MSIHFKKSTIIMSIIAALLLIIFAGFLKALALTGALIIFFLLFAICAEKFEDTSFAWVTYIIFIPLVISFAALVITVWGGINDTLDQLFLFSSHKHSHSGLASIIELFYLITFIRIYIDIKGLEK